MLVTLALGDSPFDGAVEDQSAGSCPALALKEMLATMVVHLGSLRLFAAPLSFAQARVRSHGAAMPSGSGKPKYVGGEPNPDHPKHLYVIRYRQVDQGTVVDEGR
jgi:hypothetical protein